MSATDPTTPILRISIRLPRPLWIGIAAVVLFVVAFGLRIGNLVYKQRAAIAEIQRLGGKVTVRSNQAEWLQPFIADRHLEIFDDVVLVHFRPDVATFVKRFQSPPHIGPVPWTDGPTIDDRHLVCICGLPGLKRLDLNWTNISDAGLEHVYRLRNLEELSLTGTDVSEGMIHKLKIAFPGLAVEK